MAIKIYALMNGITCLYVGKTKLSLKEREYGHKNKHNDTHSRYIPKDMEWTIELIEECDDNISIQREKYYIEYLEPLYNKQIPGRTDKEQKRSHNKAYYESHIEKYKEYYQANKEKYKEHNKKYYQSIKSQILIYRSLV